MITAACASRAKILKRARGRARIRHKVASFTFHLHKKTRRHVGATATDRLWDRKKGEISDGVSTS